MLDIAAIPIYMMLHDLDSETPHCPVDEIVRAEMAVPFNDIRLAHNMGYHNCNWFLIVEFKSLLVNFY